MDKPAPHFGQKSTNFGKPDSGLRLRQYTIIFEADSRALDRTGGFIAILQQRIERPMQNAGLHSSAFCFAAGGESP